MNLKKPPKRVDSKISCLRITVPENLDLALEGLIRKVLREQPKTDDIHSFAADYFETLLRIRDKAGAKYSSAQLCPFHNDEDAHEMIKLASSFENSGKKRSREPGPPSKGEEKGRERRNGGRGTLRRERLKKEGKQATPDLIKKLPGNRVGEKEKKGVVEENDEEESLADDPIKELVEKELMMKTETRKTGEEAKEDAEESNDVEGKEESKGKEEEAKDIVEGTDEGGKPRNEEARQERTVDEVENERTTGGEAVERVLDEKAPLPISTREEERDKKEEETDEQSEAETSAKAEATNRLLVEDKLSTAEKEMTEKDNANEIPPDAGSEVAGNGERGTEAVLKEEKSEENDSRLIADSSGSGTKAEADVQQVEEMLHSMSVNEMVESTAEEPRDKNGNETIDSINAEDVTTDNEKREASLSEKADENRKNNSEEKEQPDPTGHPKSEEKQRKNEEKSAAGEETLEDTQKIDEEAKPDETEKPETEEEVFLDGGIKRNEKAVAGGTGAEAVVPATVEIPSGPVDTEDDSKINGSDQYVEATPRKDEKDKEKPVENETTAQLFPAGEAASPIKETATADVSAVDSEPQDSEADIPGDELCTVVDVRQIPADSEVGQMKVPEECLVVEGQHIIRVEEPESANGKSVVSQPPEEVQIKTIQMHYYDTLQVPGAVTKELRVHNMAEAISGVADAGTASRRPATEEESTGDVKDDSASAGQGTSEAHISSASAEVSPVGDDPDQQEPGERVQIDVPLLLAAPSQQELGSETQRSETDDLLDLTTPTSGYSVNLSELSWQTVSGMFIDSERQHSSLISGEVRYGSPKSGGPKPEEKQESTKGRPEIEEVFYRTALPSLVGAVPIPPRDAEEIDEEENDEMLESEKEKKAEQVEKKNDEEKKVEQEEEKDDEEKKAEQVEEKNDEEKKAEQVEEKNDEEKKAEQVEENDKNGEEIEEEEKEEEKGEKTKDEEAKDEKKKEEVEEDDKKEEEKAREESLGGSSNGKSIDSDTPFISVEVKTVIETQVLDDDEEGESRPGLELKIEATVDIKDAEETRREAEGSSGGEEKETSEEKTVAGLGDVRGGPRESSSGESVSTVSSAATEIKRSDSGRRNLGSSSAKSLLTSQSLDLKGRNPLLRTRSLSTFRQGVTDFEVWNAIEKELEEAASKIQSRFRSYKTRKKLQRENAVTEEFSASTTPAEADDRQQSTGEFHDSIVLSDHPR